MIRFRIRFVHLFVIGRTSQSSRPNEDFYAPHQLHFPSVAQQLHWPSLLIIDWMDIARYSPEYIFLKEIGVREVPELTLLLDRITEKYQSTKEFYVCHELKFFSEHFQSDYSTLKDLKKCQRPFLPSLWPFSHGQQFELLSPQQTFTGSCVCFFFPDYFFSCSL